jgi:hypothetical protein
MKIRRSTTVWGGIVGAVVAGAIGVATLAGTASAATAGGGGDGTGTPVTSPRGAHVCANLDRIETAMSQRLELISERQARLATRRAQAAAAGHDQVVARIDRLAARLQDRAGRIEARTDRLTVWAADHCDSAAS